MTNIEAMKLALDALERWKEWDERLEQGMHDDIDDKAIAALRQQISEAEQAVVKESLTTQQAEQEPVGWHHPECEGQCIACLIEEAVKDAYGTQGVEYLRKHLYTAPPQREWVEPTMFQIDDACAGTQSFGEVARAVLKLSKELNPGVNESLRAQDNFRGATKMERPINQWTTIWIYEDALPEDYPYDEMFDKSRVIDGVRMFPDLTKSWVTTQNHIGEANEMAEQQGNTRSTSEYSEAEQAEQEGCGYCNHPLYAGTKCNNCGNAEQEPVTNTQLMEGYRIGLAEMREKCAKVCDEIEQDRWNLYKGRPPYTGAEAGRADPHEQGVSMGAGECAAAIRAINFEGDTGFRPVSEMIAEHKQDPKKAAAIEKAKMRKADQKPVAFRTMEVRMEPVAWYKHGPYEDGESECCVFIDPKDDDCYSPLGFIDYAAPVRTKDLTDDEIKKLQHKIDWTAEWSYVSFARAVIAAYKEKNKCR